MPEASDKRGGLARIVLIIAALVLAGLTLEASLRFLKKGQVGDYPHYYHAARAVLDGRNIYQQHERQYGYLPVFAVLNTALAPLGVGGAGAAWTVVNAVMVAAALWLGAGVVMSRLGMARGPLIRALLVAVPLLVLADKVRAEFRMGQSDALILLCFVLGLRWLDRRPWAAGVMLGFIAQFKLQSVIMLPYLLVRRRWGAAAWTVGSGVAFALGGALIWGWERNCEYLRIYFGSLLEMMGVARDVANGPALNPLSWHLSVSFPSALARLAHVFNVSEGRLAVSGTAVMAGLLFASGWWMYARHGANLFAGRAAKADGQSARLRGLVLLEWAGLIVGGLAFSPQTPVRHLFLMLVVLQIASALAIEMPRRRWMLGAAIGVFMLGLILPPGSMKEAVDAWRAVSGQLVVALVLFFVTLWCGLEWSSTRRKTEE